MRRQDKYKNIEKANLVLEQSYLKSKDLINEDNKYSFAGKWNKVPGPNKKVLDKSTKTNVGLIFAGEYYNYVIGAKNGKYLLYRFRQDENPDYVDSFNTIERAKEEVEGLERPSTFRRDDDDEFEWIKDIR